MRATRASRPRLIGHAALGALVVTAVIGMGALYTGAPTPDLTEAARDTFTAAYLRALLDRHPGDVAARCRLAREQLALGRYQDAERTLAPLVAGGEGAVSMQPALLELEVAMGAWRAASKGTPLCARAGSAGACSRSAPRTAARSGGSSTSSWRLATSTAPSRSPSGSWPARP